MKTPKVVDAMNYIDDDLVSDAITYTRKKKIGWIKWGAVAACLCLLAGAFVIPGVWNRLSDSRTSGVPVPNPDGTIQRGDEPEIYPNHPILKPGDEGYIDPGTEPPPPESGGGDTGGEPGGDGMWPEGVDPVMASVAVIPAEASLLDVAEATSVSISEEDAKNVAGLGAYLPNTLPEGCRYGKAGYYETVMKDGTRYHMIRVTYESGQASVPAPVPENAQSASEMTGNTAFLWMVWGHRPDTDLPVYQPNEMTAQLLEQQDGVFYIDYDGVYVGIAQYDISTEDLLTVIDTIG